MSKFPQGTYSRIVQAKWHDTVIIHLSVVREKLSINYSEVIEWDPWNADPFAAWNFAWSVIKDEKNMKSQRLDTQNEIAKQIIEQINRSVNLYQKINP